MSEQELKSAIISILNFIHSEKKLNSILQVIIHIA